MARGNGPFVRLAILLLGTGYSVASPLSAQPSGQGLEQVIRHPATMFDRLFGPDSPEEEKALAAIEVSRKEEEQLGRAAVNDYLEHLREQKTRVLTRGKHVAYLRRLVEIVRPSMSQAERYRQITVYLADSPICEARSLPGGVLVFFRGLLDSAESEAALVGVVGHELSHLDHNHQLARLRRVKFIRQTLSGKSKEFSPDRLFSATTAMARFWSRPFRPEDERTADLDGARWAHQAGYDPREMVRVIAKIGEREKKQPCAMPSIFCSHPPADERRQAVLDLYEQLQKAEPKDKLYIGKENLRRCVTRAEAEFPP